MITWVEAASYVVFFCIGIIFAVVIEEWSDGA